MRECVASKIENAASFCNEGFFIMTDEKDGDNVVCMGRFKKEREESVPKARLRPVEVDPDLVGISVMGVSVIINEELRTGILLTSECARSLGTRLIGAATTQELFDWEEGEGDGETEEALVETEEEDSE